MQIEKTTLNGPLIIKPDVFKDERGYFFEPYNKKNFFDESIAIEFVQDNQSMSNKGTVRGLHFQSPPFEQGKLVRVVRGAVLDVIVDIRKNSADYGKHFLLELNENNFLQFWIPAGFAHGFSVLEDNTIFEYKCTNYYSKQSEAGIRWNDEYLNIDWQVNKPIVSEKDQLLPFFQDFNSPL